MKVAGEVRLGTRVRLSDGREGVVMGNTHDAGVAVALDEGRAVWVPEKELAVIGQGPVQKPEGQPPQIVEIPPGVSVMRGGKWE
jgi:hypothetical protein